MKVPRTPRIPANPPLPAPARERPPPVRSASRLRRNAAGGTAAAPPAYRSSRSPQRAQ